MKWIHLDAETLAKFRNAGSEAVLCDESGKPAFVVEVDPYPDHEPNLSREEWKRRAAEKGGLTTVELVEYLKSSGG